MTQEIEKVLETVNELGLEHSTDHDREITIPGYGRIYYDDQHGVEPGLVVEGLDGDEQPSSPEEVCAELRRL